MAGVCLTGGLRSTGARLGILRRHAALRFLRRRRPSSASRGQFPGDPHAAEVFAHDASTLLAKITPALIEDVKLRRAQDVAHTTVDKDLAVLKAFFNWCMARSLAASNPVCRVKFFNEDNSRLRYLAEDEYSRLIKAAKTIETSPLLAEKIILCPPESQSAGRQASSSPRSEHRTRRRIGCAGWPILMSRVTSSLIVVNAAADCEGSARSRRSAETRRLA